MSVVLKVMCVVAVTGFQDAQASTSASPEVWNEIRTIVEENGSTKSPEVVAYLKSLTREEMLGAARYAWEECSKDPRFESEDDRLDACGSGIMLCLEYYLKESDTEECVGELLDIARDTTDCFALRYAIVASMWNAGARNRFPKELPSYVIGHLPRVEPVLVAIVQNRSEKPLLRGEALQTLLGLLGEHARKTCESDPRVREALDEERRHTDKPVTVGELLRAGELTPTDETVKALEPLEARALTYVKLLGAILADKKNEPEQLRKRAKRALERSYKTLPFPDLDEEINKALQKCED